MRLLICTQTIDMNDPILGFFHQWVDEFAHSYEKVTVICLNEGVHHLPDNVRVLSLGKERGNSRLQYIRSFYQHIWNERREYDSVFVHMNQIYVLLGALLWRAWGKRVGLWYVHRSVAPSLHAAVLLAHVIFTTSPESFRINTNKRNCLGHGIDTNHFAKQERSKSSELQVITTGRISETKRIKEMIDAVVLLAQRGISAQLTVVGAPVTQKEKLYAIEMQTYAQRKPVHFVGPVEHQKIPAFLEKTNVFLNLSATESMDKAVLEALATNLPVVTSNKAFRDLVTPYGLFVPEIDVELIADALEHSLSVDISALSQRVRDENSLKGLTGRIVELLN